MSVFVLVLTYTGLLSLCLAMPKHYKQVARREPRRTVRHLLRMLGLMMLALSFTSSVAAAGWSLGPVEWVGLLAVTGLVLVFLLPYSPRMAAALGLLGLVCAPVVLWLLSHLLNS